MAQIGPDEIADVGLTGAELIILLDCLDLARYYLTQAEYQPLYNMLLANLENGD